VNADLVRPDEEERWNPGTGGSASRALTGNSAASNATTCSTPTDPPNGSAHKPAAAAGGRRPTPAARGRRIAADDLLPDLLSLAVPLWIRDLEHLTFDQRQDRARRCAEVLRGPSMGEAVSFPIKGKSRLAFNALAEGIACCAYQPGGIKCFGHHFQAEHNDGGRGCLAPTHIST
jgi:hypothetical protein